jgi:hypothetical protein
MSRLADGTGALTEERLFLPVECAFFESVNVADHQDRYEAEHTPEDHFALHDRLFVNHRPRIHENDLEIEEDEQHGDEVKLHAEPRRRFPLRHHAALVGHILCARPLAGLADQNANQQGRGSKTYRDDDLQKDRQIFLQHLRFGIEDPVR